MSESADTLFEGRFLRLCRKGRWEYVQRVSARGAVHIVAVTPENELLLVEQFRQPVGARALELPAGIVGDDEAHRGESAESAAARELVEETGYRPARVTVLHRGPSAPGLTSEVITLVHAQGLTRVGDGGGVGSEEITVHRVPLGEVPQWLGERIADGALVDHRVFAGLYLLGA